MSWPDGEEVSKLEGMNVEANEVRKRFRTFVEVLGGAGPLVN